MNNRDRHRRHNNNWKKDNNNSNNNSNNNNNYNNNSNNNRRDDNQRQNFKKEFRKPKQVVTQQQIREEDEKIKEFKAANRPNCCKCGEIITDMSQAISDKATGAPMHFDCALEAVSNTEKLGPGDKIVYIGQGRFGVVNWENPHDMKHFKIVKIIELEDREKKAEWRENMAELYSQVK